MFIAVIIFLIICFVLIFHHGVEIVFNAHGSKYEFGLYYLLLGKIRLFEIKHIKLKKKEKKAKKEFDTGFLRYLRGNIDVSYTIATANLTPTYALTSSALCSLLESIDTLTNIKVIQNIQYTNWGFSFDLKIHMSVLNIIISFIEYKIKTRKKLFA